MMIPATPTTEILIDPEQEDRAREIYHSRLRSLGDLTQPVSNAPHAFPLRPSQVEGVEFLLKTQFAILGDEMGLGKTVQSLVAAKAYHLEGYFVYVVAPVTLHSDWKKEAAKVDVPIEIFSWAKLPKPLEHTPYILIADEAHYAQNGALTQGLWNLPLGKYEIHPDTGKKRWIYQCKRTRDVLALAERASAVFLLTGTSLKNAKAENLYPLLVAIRHPLTQGGDIEKVYKAYVHTFGEKSHNPYRFHHLYDETKHVRLRRLKKHVLTELPEKLRIPRQLEISAQAQSRYETTFALLRKRYQDRIDDGTIGVGAERLVLLNHLRYAASVSKVDAVIAFAEKVFEEGEGETSLLVFSDFVETAHAIAQGLKHHGISHIDGSTPQKERTRLVAAFQAGEHKGFVSTIETGGLGLNLQRASTVLLVDRPWTPGAAFQAEDRAHRIGQTNAVFVYWLRALYANDEHNIDTLIDRRLLNKAQHIADASGEENAFADDKDLLATILDEIFGYGNPCRRYHEVRTICPECAKQAA